MSLEDFIVGDSGEGMSESAFEAFKEKMKAASAQIAAIKKDEGNQKKKETKLYKILIKFIQQSDKKALTTIISRALEQNTPANFILAIIFLGNEEIKKELGDFIILNTEKEEQEAQNETSKAVTFFETEDKSFPLKMRGEIDNWIKNMLLQAQESPQKLIKTAFVETTRAEQEDNVFEASDTKRKRTIKRILPTLISFVLRDYVEQNDIDEPKEKLDNFSFFIIKGILSKIKDSLENRKLIKENEATH